MDSITHGALQDHVFTPQSRADPFNSVREFNHWFSQLLRLVLPNLWRVSEAEHDPKITQHLNFWRTEFPDRVPITFTQGDLYRGNIMIAPADLLCVLATVDWAYGV